MGNELQYKEGMIRSWFNMWLQKNDAGIGSLFTHNATYIESWGPEYHGLEKIRHWFSEWNSRGTVLAWDIQRFFHDSDKSIVLWTFECAMQEGPKQGFDGVSLIVWDKDLKISYLQEYGCSTERYDPYAAGDKPVFKEVKSPWS